MANAELLDGYLAGVETLQRAVTGMTREQVTARPVPGKWSTLEVVAHLADFEPIFSSRIKQIIADERPLLMSADEQTFARSLAYQERALDEEVQIIALTRQQLTRILKSLPAETLQRSGVHSFDGVVTIEQILTKATRHIRHHVPFIVEKKKALGLPA